MEEIRRFMLFRGERYPEERGAVKGEAFLIPLAVKGNVPSATQNHAPNAIVYLYRQISREGSGWLRGINRVTRYSPRQEAGHQSVVFPRDEERAVLARLEGGVRCGMAIRLYGFGLRLMEYAGCASGTSIWNKTRSGDSGFDFKLPSC